MTLALTPDAPIVQRIDTYQDVAIQRLGEWAHSADAAYGIAQKLVQTTFCPEAFRNKPGEATAAILAGMEVGLQPMAALRSFDVIQGQAAPRAITLRAIAQSFGHEVVMVESTATRCKMRGRRRGSNEWQEVVWTMDRAKQLGVTSKANWRNQPQAMLVARATSEIARLIASDAILGLGYSAEEVADGGTFEQTVTTETTAPAEQGGTRRMSRAPREPEPTPEPEVVDDEPITDAQMKLLQAHYKDVDRDDRLAEASEILNQVILSFSELTKAGASKLIDTLQQRDSLFEQHVADAP